MTQSTVHGNGVASGGVGGLVQTGGTQVLAGNIVSGNGGAGTADCNAGFTDGGYNNGPATCGFSVANNDQLSAAVMNSLTNNGGPTRTKAPKPQPVDRADPGEHGVARARPRRWWRGDALRRRRDRPARRGPPERHAV